MVFTQSQIQDVQSIIENTFKTLVLDKTFLLQMAKTVQETLQENFVEINNKLVNLEQQVSMMEIQNSQLVEENKTLSVELDRLQQYTRRNNVRIFGLKSDHQTVESSVIKILNDTLKLDVNVGAIDRCHHVGGLTKRHVIVKFVSYRDRDRVLRNRRMLKGSGISITEDLTKARVNLFKRAQELFKRENVWTLDGAIFVRNRDGKNRVTTEAELLAISGRE